MNDFVQKVPTPKHNPTDQECLNTLVQLIHQASEYAKQHLVCSEYYEKLLDIEKDVAIRYTANDLVNALDEQEK